MATRSDSGHSGSSLPDKIAAIFYEKGSLSILDQHSQVTTLLSGSTNEELIACFKDPTFTLLYRRLLNKLLFLKRALISQVQEVSSVREPSDLVLREWEEKISTSASRLALPVFNGSQLSEDGNAQEGIAHAYAFHSLINKDLPPWPSARFWESLEETCSDDTAREDVEKENDEGKMHKQSWHQMNSNEDRLKVALQTLEVTSGIAKRLSKAAPGVFHPLYTDLFLAAHAFRCPEHVKDLVFNPHFFVSDTTLGFVSYVDYFLYLYFGARICLSLQSPAVAFIYLISTCCMDERAKHDLLKSQNVKEIIFDTGILLLPLCLLMFFKNIESLKSIEKILNTVRRISPRPLQPTSSSEASSSSSASFSYSGSDSRPPLPLPSAHKIDQSWVQNPAEKVNPFFDEVAVRIILDDLSSCASSWNGLTYSLAPSVRDRNNILNNAAFLLVKATRNPALNHLSPEHLKVLRSSQNYFIEACQNLSHMRLPHHRNLMRYLVVSSVMLRLQSLSTLFSSIPKNALDTVFKHFYPEGCTSSYLEDLQEAICSSPRDALAKSHKLLSIADQLWPEFKFEVHETSIILCRGNHKSNEEKVEILQNLIMSLTDLQSNMQRRTAERKKYVSKYGALLERYKQPSASILNRQNTKAHQQANDRAQSLNDEEERQVMAAMRASLEDLSSTKIANAGSIE